MLKITLPIADLKVSNIRGPLLSCVLLLNLLFPSIAQAGRGRALFSLDTVAGTPFPSDLFAVADPTQNTGLRVNLPKPDCLARPSDCQDLDVINTLDGFNLQPRLSIPFSGRIDVSTVNSSTVFRVRLGPGPGREVVGINQVVWDPATNTLHAESDELLDQHTSYLLVVTTGVRDAEGDPIEPGAFEDFLESRRHHDHELADYRRELWNALERAHVRGRIAVASVFTTQSATAVLEKIRREIKSWEPLPATMRGTFPLASLTAIQWSRQTGTAPSFTVSFLPLPALSVLPGSVSAIAFGSFASPDWETPEKFIPPIGTRTGVPVVQRINELFFNLFIPPGTRPAAGWPFSIFWH